MDLGRELSVRSGEADATPWLVDRIVSLVASSPRSANCRDFQSHTLGMAEALHLSVATAPELRRRAERARRAAEPFRKRTTSCVEGATSAIAHYHRYSDAFYLLP